MAWKLAQAIEKRHLSKAAMARAINPGRTYPDRPLAPEDDAPLPLHTLTSAT